MTKQTVNRDILLSLWSLEQNFKQKQPKHDHITFLYSGGQDSSTLAWFLYHTEPSPQNRLNLVHCAHLMQQDTFFMAQHAVNLSFWLGWGHTTFFPTQALASEKQASCWRVALLNQINSYTATDITINGHTETDKRESDFFQFARTRESTNQAVPTDRRLANGFHVDNNVSSQYTMKARLKQTWGAHIHPSTPLAQNALAAYMGDPAAASKRNTFVSRALCRPLMILERKDTRTIAALQKLPVYPDQTNFECQTTRAQVRYLVFPLLAKLGFDFFG